MIAALLILVPMLAWGESEAPWQKPVFRDVSVHDPAILRGKDGSYYVFGSHMAAARSEDLMQWRMISRDANFVRCLKTCSRSWPV